MSKIKGARLSQLREKAKQSRKAEKNHGGNQQALFHKIESGKNVFRILPAHDTEELPYEVSYSTMLECDVKKYKDGEPTGDTERKAKKIPNAVQHGGLSKDPIDEYIRIAYEMAEELSSDEGKEFLEPITGSFTKKGVFGIKFRKTWVCYAADSQGQVGRLDLWPKWLDKMVEISLEQEEDDDDVSDVDIFSDPESGVPVIIKKLKEGSKNVYEIEAGSPKKGQNWSDYLESVKVTDDMMTQLKNNKPLKELFVDSYTKEHLKLALNGLKIFDKENEFGIYDSEEFQEIAKEIAAELAGKSEPESTPPKKAKPSVKTTKKASKPTEKEMIEFLVEYVSENYDEDKELPELEGVELVKWYNLAKDEQELPFPEDETEEVEVDTEVEEDDDEETDSGKVDVRAALAEIRNKRKKK